MTGDNNSDVGGRARDSLAVRLATILFMSSRFQQMAPTLRFRLIATLFGRASNVVMVGFAAVVCGASAWHHERSIVLAAISGVEVVVLFGRAGIIVAFQRAQLERRSIHVESWLAPFGCLAVMSSCSWGAMCFTALTTAHDPIVYMLPVISTVATAGAIAARNSGVPRIAQAQLCCSLLPLFAGCAVASNDSLRMLVLLVPALAIGLLVLIAERHDEMVELIETQTELQRLSSTDALTQVANRRAFDLALRAACARGEVISLLMIDVDNFKSFNDRHGHPEGDVILKTIAATLQQGLGARRDQVARFGGEEFSVLLDGGRTEAALVAEHLRLLVASACKDPSDHSPVTISVGVATTSGGDPAHLLARADKALYGAKSRGRNRIEESAFAAAA